MKGKIANWYTILIVTIVPMNHCRCIVYSNIIDLIDSVVFPSIISG